MIKYRSGAFGFQVLLRLHGSAFAKAMVPSAASTVFYISFFHLFDLHKEEDRIFDHPYPMGALIAAFTFLLTFKTSFSYNRYWEAVTVVHQMHSKWLDVGMELAAFHLQSSRYKHPPAFGEHPEAISVKRERERLNAMTRQDLEEQLDSIAKVDQSLRHRLQKMWSGKQSRVPNRPQAKSINAPLQRPSSAPKQLTGRSALLRKSRGTSIIRTMVPEEEFDPSLLLQEAAHLLSLLSAVALSTLRNDIEQAESPLSRFEPGAAWPHVDPDDYAADVRGDWGSTHRSIVVARYLLGFTRTARKRTMYNAARPFRVVGGVSDVEIARLQKARGPLAKVALCTMWLQEFVAREHLGGGLGAVGAPIVSRLFQYTSDGMIGYNQARKIAYIPFPFPHAQITSLYVVVMVVFVPIIMLSYVTNEVFGAFLTFFSVLCFVGLYEVSRELENPFLNVPNDIPLNNFQAQFNEALMTMYDGYHPDAFWVVEEVEEEEESSGHLQLLEKTEEEKEPDEEEDEEDEDEEEEEEMEKTS